MFLGSFTVSVSGEVVLWNEPRKILVSFQAPHAGEFRMCLQIDFHDTTQLNGRRFVVHRELRGRATLPDNHVDITHPKELSLESDQVDDHTAFSTCEEEVLPDSEGTGISVSDEDGVDFGIVEREGLNGPFPNPSFSVTINHAKGFPTVTFVEARIRSSEGSDSR